MLLSAFFLQWFSQVDIMDGCRARRCKAGSPLGRLIDEGGDTITMANYSILLAYGWCFTSPFSELVFFTLNAVFFSMELKYVITGQLVMVVGELSSIEFEIIFSTILLLMGIFGNEGLSSTIGSTFGIAAGSESALHVIYE
jgi:phosphatidylglycerophosphate synthase